MSASLVTPPRAEEVTEALAAVARGVCARLPALDIAADGRGSPCEVRSRGVGGWLSVEEEDSSVLPIAVVCGGGARSPPPLSPPALYLSLASSPSHPSPGCIPPGHLVHGLHRRHGHPSHAPARRRPGVRHPPPPASRFPHLLPLPPLHAACSHPRVDDRPVILAGWSLGLAGRPWLLRLRRRRLRVSRDTRVASHPSPPLNHDVISRWPVDDWWRHLCWRYGRWWHLCARQPRGGRGRVGFGAPTRLRYGIGTRTRTRRRATCEQQAEPHDLEASGRRATWPRLSWHAPPRLLLPAQERPRSALRARVPRCAADGSATWRRSLELARARGERARPPCAMRLCSDRSTARAQARSPVLE
mmetsp:Transcript_81097/g.161234  ORF Transcript_81097/g.161234 Transcript_81097/m.161234 type:complete len:359 (-) Transcript_81097:1315-2391(-)